MTLLDKLVKKIDESEFWVIFAVITSLPFLPFFLPALILFKRTKPTHIESIKHNLTDQDAKELYTPTFLMAMLWLAVWGLL